MVRVTRYLAAISPYGWLAWPAMLLVCKGAIVLLQSYCVVDKSEGIDC